MIKHLQLKKVLATLLTIAALFAGHQAFATITQTVTFQGMTYTQNNTDYYSLEIRSPWGTLRLPNQQGTYREFNNAHLGWNPVDVTLNGKLNFQTSTTPTDVVTGSNFYVTFASQSLWFSGASVKKLDGTIVNHTQVIVSSDNHTVAVNFNFSDMVFGQIILNYAPNEPLSSSNTTISGVEDEYIYYGSPIEPVPTVTYYGTVLTEGTDYTLAYHNTGVGDSYVQVTGIGNYAGTVNKYYTIRNLAPSDFNSLGNNTYEIATTDDLDNLAVLVNVANNECQGLTFKQTADIAYTYTTAWNNSNSVETNFTTIGGWGKPFEGTYDGQNHSISGIRISKTGTSPLDRCQGLFGNVYTSGTVSNVVIADTRIQGYIGTGGIVGVNAGTVSNCFAIHTAIIGDQYAAAIVGDNSGTLTANYYHDCNVTNGNHPNGSSIGVGVGTNDGSEDQDGACSAHTLTLPSNVTATGESVTISGTTYYASNTTVTLAYNNVPAGQMPVYSVNGTAIEGNTFMMPAADRTVSVSMVNVWSGSGTQGNPYVITTTAQLDLLAKMVDGLDGYTPSPYSNTYFVLGNDIEYSTVGLGDTDENFTTIGGYFNGGDKNFSGTFDGQNHTISGIRLYKSGTGNADKNLGLFGRIDGATIKRVILTDARITGYRYVGGLVGNKVSGTVQNCLVINSTITCGNTYVGALFGANSGTITNNYYHSCTVNGTATGVGVGANGGVSSSSDKDGARSVHTLTLGENITATGESVTYQGTTWYASNKTVTLNHNEQAEGYQVVYSLNGTPLTGNSFTMPANDVAVSATVTLITYTITYDLDGGEASNPTTYTVETETFTLAIPTKTGYGFTGWTGTDLTEPTQTVTITQGSMGDRSYTAHWIRTYTITYNLGGGSATNPITYTAETPTFTLENPILVGCVFEGWTGTDLTEPTQTVTITQGSTGDREYTAQWTDFWGVFDGADGSIDHPYTITTPEGLVYLSDFSRSNTTTTYYFYVLGADIDMSSVDNFTPIGNKVSGWWYFDYYFDGYFDGQGHTISHLTVNTTGTNVPGGLFAGNIGSFIWNIILDSANITAEKYAGGIVGFREDDSYYLTNCLVLNSTITATASDGHAGAIIGGSWIPIYNSTLSHNYYHNCTVNGTANATNVGTGSDVNPEHGYFSDPYDDTTDDGAMPVFSLTLGENITAAPACAINFYNMITHNVFTYDGPLFYTAGTSITIEANEGYAITSATLTYGGNDYPIEPVEGVYSFEMPGEDATVSATIGQVSTFTKDIAGYGDSDGGYYLIASPLNGNVTPAEVGGMLTDNFDLYRFNPGAALEWENYLTHTNDFVLEPGKGYLYASEEDTQLVFIGAPYSGDGTVTLTVAEEGEGIEFPGMNLVGNPFADEAYITDRPFYVMDGNGERILPDAPGSSYAIQPMEGVFVDAEQNGDIVTFTTEAPGAKANIVLNLTQGRSRTIDRAIISVGQGHTLPKFMLNPDDTKLYMPQNGEDYAVVRSRNSDEIPVSFEPAEDGFYTISVDVRNMNLRALNLKDNVRNVSVDLLRTPSYQFKASTEDRADRFILSFRTNSGIYKEKVVKGANSEDFGFYSYGNWIIDNPSTGSGPATLQVIDLNGRVLSSENIYGSTSIQVDAAPGVYMLRLINGDDVKTQKIVIQ